MTDIGIIPGILGVTTFVMAVIVWRLRIEAVSARREKRIRSYVFSGYLFDKLKEKHKHLELKECQLVARALREFFLAHLKSGRRYVGMPSRVVDDLWHEFILDTREYRRFCGEAFGRYFHHTPATSMGKADSEDAGLRLTWRYACIEENINWRKATRLPLLFAIDEKLKITGGFHYTLQQLDKKGQEGSSGRCSGACGGGSGFACSGAGLVGGSSTSRSDSSVASCSGGDGGGGGNGCGGGCGGS